MKRYTALYIRVSTDAQYEEGYSVDAQKEKLEQFCKLRDIKNYEFFIDGGWSGSNIDRPEMKRMVAEITAGNVESVVVYKLDRLSRSQKDTIFLLEDIFIPNDCNFISLNENFDTTTPYGKAMIGILSVFAQLERENIRERTRMGMHERVKSGLWMGGGRVPFGYDYDSSKGILVPNEHADDVKQIFDLYIKGYSAGKLAKMFDVANDTHIMHILERPIYRGYILYNGELIKGQHQAIIDDDTWERAQLARKKRSVVKTNTNSYLLSGLVVCGICGAKFRYQRWGKNGLKLYCYSQQKSKPSLVKDPNCDNYRYDADVLEEVVLNSIFEYTDTLKIAEQKQTSSANALQVLQSRYDSISAKIKRLYNLYATSEDELLLDTINENKAELLAVSKLIDVEQKTTDVIKDINKQLKDLCNLREMWPTMSIFDRQQALKSCVAGIYINKEDIKVEFRY